MFFQNLYNITKLIVGAVQISRGFINGFVVGLSETASFLAVISYLAFTVVFSYKVNLYFVPILLFAVIKSYSLLLFFNELEKARALLISHSRQKRSKARSSVEKYRDYVWVRAQICLNIVYTVIFTKILFSWFTSSVSSYSASKHETSFSVFLFSYGIIYPSVADFIMLCLATLPLADYLLFRRRLNQGRFGLNSLEGLELASFIITAKAGDGDGVLPGLRDERKVQEDKPVHVGIPVGGS